MTVKIKTIEGSTEVFATESFTIGPVKSWRPDIMSVRIYDSGVPVAERHRPFPLLYRRLVWPRKDVQDAMERIRQAEARARENNP